MASGAVPTLVVDVSTLGETVACERVNIRVIEPMNLDQIRFERAHRRAERGMIRRKVAGGRKWERGAFYFDGAPVAEGETHFVTGLKEKIGCLDGHPVCAAAQVTRTVVDEKDSQSKREGTSEDGAGSAFRGEDDDAWGGGPRGRGSLAGSEARIIQAVLIPAWSLSALRWII